MRNTSAAGGGEDRLPTASQRQILRALAARPGARIVPVGGYYYIAAAATLRPRSGTISELLRHGWIVARSSRSRGRTEYVLTASGREVAQ